jgi:hypothetical protein
MRLLLIRLECGAALLCEPLCALRVLHWQIVRLRETDHMLYKRAVARNKRLTEPGRRRGPTVDWQARRARSTGKPEPLGV